MPIVPTRRSLLRAGLGLAAAQAIPFCAARAAEPPHDVTWLEDFDELWRTLGERYCFFAGKQTDWNAVRALYRPLAAAAGTREALAGIVGRTINELYDAHTHMADAADGSPRLPYLDLWVEPGASGALVTGVREGSVAANAGIVPGDTVLRVDGVPVDRCAAAVMPRCLARPDPAASTHALNVAVSGRRARPRLISLRTAGGVEREVPLPLRQQAALPDVEARALPGGYGCIVIRSFSDHAVVDAVDAALVRFRDAAGLVIDVRQNGGGDTGVARPIMGRFITGRLPYARMRRRDGAGLGEAWTESVDPRGPFTFRAPVVVTTTRWSASMAEGFPMGMRAIGRAKIVGTPMMGLGAAVFPLLLDRTGIRLQYSAESVYDVEDRPRWLLEPDVPVAPGGDIMAAAMATLDIATGRRPAR